MSCPDTTSSPGPTKSSTTTPDRGHGISSAVFPVSRTITGSSRSIVSPGRTRISSTNTAPLPQLLGKANLDLRLRAIASSKKMLLDGRGINNDWRERERDRDRAERERNRAERDRIAREREQDRRNQQARDADRRQREREQADRQRRDAERNRARAESRNPDGSPRTDYDRYNPSNGRWMPHADKMP